jgi:hypothetical protein
MNGMNEAVKEKHAEKLGWLGKLAEFNPKNELRVATTIDGRRIGRWFPFKEWLDISYIDHVTVLPNECIWEIDHDDWNFVRKHGNRILEALDRFEVPHVQGPTSGRGVHIHAFFIMPERNLRNRCDEYGVLPRELRNALFSLICSEAGVPSNMVGKGLPFDTGCVDFSDLSMGHMVRAFGGRKFAGGQLTGYKSFVQEIPEERVRIIRFTEVRFPRNIIPYSVPKTIIEGILIGMEKRKQDALKNSCRVHDGLYLDAPCVRELLKTGLARGSRNRGAQLIAIACRLSGLRMETAEEVAREYFEKCEKSDFMFPEIQGWLRWAYSREVDWRCSQAIPFGMCQPHKCGVAQMNAPGMKRGPANPVWLKKWQRAPTVGWMQGKRW